MEPFEFIYIPAPEMSLVAYNCSQEVSEFHYASNQIFVNSELQRTPDPYWYSQVEWENMLDDELDSFFDGWTNNDLYKTPDGKFWAVNIIYNGKEFIPLHWREVEK